MVGISVRDLAQSVGGTVYGPDDVSITGAASVTEAEPGDIVLAENARFLSIAKNSKASAVITSEQSCGDKTVIQVDDPRSAFAVVLGCLAPDNKPEPGIDPTARVGESVTLGENVSIGYGCWIGDDVTIGDGAVIYPLAYIGCGVKIGAGSVVYPHVVIYQDCEIGSGVVIHAGTVIGADGFGYIPVDGKLCKVPQIGKVVIEDDVEIGANATIDRAKTGITHIGRGAKIDNLVQVAHNVKIGPGSVICAQVGIAGSTELGSGVTMAGQSGVRDHVSIGDGAVVAGQAGIFGDLPGGATYSGYPARPHKEMLRVQSAIMHLPETVKMIEELRKEVERLKQQLDGGKSGS